jgi:soluble lytic murein transglycosylase-like protein
MTLIPVIGLIMVIFFSAPKKEAIDPIQQNHHSSHKTYQLNTPFVETPKPQVLFSKIEEKIHEDAPAKVIPQKKSAIQEIKDDISEEIKASLFVEKKAAPQKALVEIDQPLQLESTDYQAILTYINTNYPNTPASDAEEIATHLVAYGQEHQVDPKLIAALIARESSFNKKAVSKTGAMGLGQIKSLNFEHLKITDPFDIKDNIKGTVTYMNHLMTVWKDKSERVQWALASYYKGPTAIRRSQGQIDEQTKNYVSDILKYYDSITQVKESILSTKRR